MTIVLDLILVAIIAIYVIICAKRGFVDVVVETVGTIAAIVLAFTFSTPLATFTYDRFFGPAIIDALTKSTAGVTQVTAEQMMGILPTPIVEGAGLFGVDLAAAVENITAAASGNVTETIANLSENAIKPIAVSIIGLAVTVILFMVLSIVAKLLAKLLNKLFSFSFVGKINHTLGGVVGAVKGIVIAAIFCIGVSFLISILGRGIWIFTAENIEGTFLFKFLAGLSQFIKF